MFLTFDDIDFGILVLKEFFVMRVMGQGTFIGIRADMKLPLFIDIIPFESMIAYSKMGYLWYASRLARGFTWRKPVRFFLLMTSEINYSH